MAPLIAGWSRTNIFSPAWVEALAPVPKSGMTADIMIYYCEAPTTYDSVTGKYVYSRESVETIYEGKARVQPLRMARNVPNNAGDTLVQAVRFQIGDMSVVLRPEYRVRVVSAPLNPSLEKFEYIIQGLMNSSNPFELTFETQVDTEVQLDY